MVVLKVVLCVCVCFTVITIVQGKIKCKDRLRGCSSYPKNFCYGNFKNFMESNCANYCGYCNCLNWKYGCCKDHKTHADGPNKRGCAIKLCYDKEIILCPEVKRNGTCYKEYNKEECAWTCGYCIKMPAPMKRCRDIGYGCCWDGTTALGPNKQGCPPCFDFFKAACRRFQVKPSCTNTGAYHLRTFLLKYCHETCGHCESCRDRDSRCARFERKGYCYLSRWKSYLKSYCAKTCRFCKGDSGTFPLP